MALSPNNQMKPYQPGESAADSIFDSQRLNVPLKEIDRLRQFINDEALPVQDSIAGEKYIIGRVTLTPPPLNGQTQQDYTDCRYFVNLMQSKPNRGRDTKSETEPATESGYRLCVTATNMLEKQGESHLLADKTEVRLYAIEANDATGDIHYVFWKEPKAACKVTAVTGTFPEWTYTVRKVKGFRADLTGSARYVTETTDLTAYNSFESNDDDAAYTHATGVGITDIETGQVDGGDCTIIPIGVGAIVEVSPIPTLDASNAVTGYRLMFYAPNSAGGA